MTDPLVAYLLAAMTSWSPAPAPVVRASYVPIAEAIARASKDPELDVVLASIALWESGFRIHARGKAGEVGPWQIMPPAPINLIDQAAKARQLVAHSYEKCGTLAFYASGRCDRGTRAAARREETAMSWLREHPFRFWDSDPSNPEFWRS